MCETVQVAHPVAPRGGVQGEPCCPPVLLPSPQPTELSERVPPAVVALMPTDTPAPLPDPATGVSAAETFGAPGAGADVACEVACGDATSRAPGVVGVRPGVVETVTAVPNGEVTPAPTGEPAPALRPEVGPGADGDGCT